MSTAQAIIDRAATVGIKAKVWQKNSLLRIYAQVDRKDMQVWLALDGATDDVTGAAFVVRGSTPQHKNWVAAQERDYRDLFIGLFHSYVVEQYGTDTAVLGYGPSIVNMIEAARAWFAQRAAEKVAEDADVEG